MYDNSKKHKNLKRKKEREGVLTNSFYKTSVTLTTILGKDTRIKENHRRIFLINTDANFLKIIHANWIQEYIKKIIHHDQVG
jgi:hypothetical protein